MRLIVGTPEGVQVYRWLAGERSAQLKVEAMEHHPVTSIWAAEDAIFCGTETGRLYVSRDRGDTWAPRFRVPDGSAVRSVSGRHGGEILYVGVEPAGIFVSTDGGGEWKEMEHLVNLGRRENWKDYADRSAHVQALAPDPLDESRVYAGIEVGGAYRSDDGGSTWKPIHMGLSEDVHVMAADPTRPGRVWAATGNGLFESDDRGADWEVVDERLAGAYCTAFRLHADDPERDGPALIVATATAAETAWGERESGAEPRLFESSDGGATWRERSLWAALAIRDGITGLAWDLAGPGHFFAGTSGGEIHYSLAADEGWVYVQGALPPIRALEVV